MPLIPSGEPSGRSQSDEMTEVWRNIKALWAIANKSGHANARVFVGPEPPPDPQIGDLWFDTDEPVLDGDR